jgi:hypothetical protein
MGFLCALLRDLGRSFDAAEFWANSPKFAREERKFESGLLPVWLPPLLEILAIAVRERAGQALGQSAADIRKIVTAAVPLGVKGRRSEFVTIEAAIRPEYPASATVGRRPRMVAAAWALRLVLYVANHVVVRDAEERAARELASFADIAAEFGIPTDTLTRCMILTSDGVGSDPPPTVAVASDPTRNYTLAPVPAFMGWAHPRRENNEEGGVAWRGSCLVAREVAPSSYAYPENLADGTTRATCNVLAHGVKDQGEGTLCKGCRMGSSLTGRFQNPAVRSSVRNPKYPTTVSGGDVGRAVHPPCIPYGQELMVRRVANLQQNLSCIRNEDATTNVPTTNEPNMANMTRNRLMKACTITLS